MNIHVAIFLLPGLLVGITVHEAAHALSAKWLGDRFPQRQGRISLNPFRHLSLIGTLALFLLGFGWGKPVVINIYNFKKPKLYYLLSSLAGPASNLILCGLSLGIMHLYKGDFVRFICISIFFTNAILAVVNLLPVPPLDGSKIWPCIIPGLRPTVSGKWSSIWMVVLLVIVFSGSLDKTIGAVLGFLSKLLPAGIN